MIVPQLKGGLGNQMFTIAAGISHALKTGNEFAINYNIKHHGQQGKPHITYRDNFYKNIKCTDFIPSYEYVEPKYSYSEIPDKQDVLINGYFQSEKYFDRYKSEINRSFNFADDIKEKIDKKLQTLNKKILGIHVRIGDYLSPVNYHSHFICTDVYYKNALKEFNLDDYIVIVCTDDPTNLFNVFPKQDIILSNCKSEIEDLYLLSQCDAHILTNSSFSWWSNFLGKEKEKTVVPDKWFGPHGPKDIQDVYREGWIKIATSL